MKQLIFTFSLLLSASFIYCQPGSIDQSFGNKGFVRTNTQETGFLSLGRASVLLPDGKILVGGQYSDFPVIRYLPDGTIDSSFGKNGIATVTGGDGYVADIAVQEDGKIVVAVNSGTRDPDDDVLAIRLTPDGLLDTDYGVNGIVGLNFEDYAAVSAITLQPDGKALLAGGGSTDPDVVYIFDYGTVTRLNTDGSIDKTFGGDGRIENRAVNNNEALAVQPDGKIVATGGQVFTSDFLPDYVVSRYNADGTLDNNFGNGGNITTNGFGNDDIPESILVQPDNKIVIAVYSSGYAMTALRYTEKGALDNAFGDEGKANVVFQGNTSRAYQALLQSDGKIVLTGAAYSNNQKNYGDFALCRLNTDGSVDSSFAINGRQVTVTDNENDAAQSSLLQPDDKIVLVGLSESNGGDDLTTLLIRYNGDKGQSSLFAKIKRFLHNHGIGWQGLDANINYYSVQYSKTGSGFTEKGKVSGAGSSQFTPYEFAVADAGYYRIVAVDREGYKTFSNKVMVNEADVASSASVFPNPAKNYVTVQGLQTNETANISIADGSGNIMSKGVSNGSTQYRSPLNNMQPGTYYVNITTATKTEVLKFVKE